MKHAHYYLPMTEHKFGLLAKDFVEQQQSKVFHYKHEKRKM